MLVGVENVAVSGQLSQCHIFKKLLKTSKSVMIDILMMSCSSAGINCLLGRFGCILWS